MIVLKNIFIKKQLSAGCTFRWLIKQREKQEQIISNPSNTINLVD